MKNIKIKVCGMRDPANIAGISKAGPDYMGFIFYGKSSRFVGEQPDSNIFDRLPSSVTKVGVFVNEDTHRILEICRKYGLGAAQLHGNEPPDECREIRNSGLVVIKAFPVSEGFDFDITETYRHVTDYFLFDTKGALYGGNGMKYNWQILDNYNNDIPFFISGGIDANDIEELKKLNHPMFFAVDINSRFELAPALKDVDSVQKFIEKIRNFVSA